MYTQEQCDRFYERFSRKAFADVEEAIDAMPDSDPDKEAFRNRLVDDIIDGNTLGFLRYGKKGSRISKDAAAILQRNRDPKSHWVPAFIAFIKGNKTECLKQLRQRLVGGDETPINEQIFSDLVLTPFKNAFPGFYKEVRKMLDETPAEDAVKCVCEALDAFYETEDPDIMAETLYPVIQRYPDSVIANTLLGYAYYTGKRYGNAIACFEKGEGKFPCMFWDFDLFFFKGYAYGRLREHQNAIESYQKALELEPDAAFALNNMGYEFYLLKQYPRALEIFQKCIDEERDFPYPVNNLARTLLAMRRYKDALDFIETAPRKVSSDIVKRAKRKPYVNEEAAAPAAPEDEIEDAGDEDGGEAASGEAAEALQPSKAAGGVRFSSEKILEDELALRIDAGVPVFGKKLKIYRRHGEYGRQYIIPIGRLDLLAEDDDGNLYIIELKKDSGYDDPYAQTAAYLDWFAANKPAGAKEFYGIICLNDPTPKLVADIRGDGRVRLFNYSIVYEEII